MVDMSQAHYIRTQTTVKYPDGGPEYAKWDYFSIPVEKLPEHWHSLSMDEKYDFLNDNGYWLKGWQDIDEEMDAWIDDHDDYHGAQDEIVVEVDFL